jgi:glucan phosphoethanolaminetransferase (alkaline phosphatase superfamily)
MLRLRLFIVVHVLVSTVVATVFAWRFGYTMRPVLAHTLLVAEWDLAFAALMSGLLAVCSQAGARWLRIVYRGVMAVTCTLQVYLYALNLVSNLSWGRTMSGHLVAAFAPTVWSGKEPFPVGPIGITVFFSGTFALMAAIFGRWGDVVDGSLAPWRRAGRLPALAVGVALAVLFCATFQHGVVSRNELLWNQELIASFFRPDGFAFEPTARRYAVAERDAALEAAYSRQVTSAPRKNIVLIIVDSLRADRMQAYGYERPTTPFLSQLVRSGRMKKVESAFSTCSESFCGITSTLASREFRDISVRTFELQDVLRAAGYQTWFLLSGNHTSWNGLPQFYRATADTFFDGSATRRYTMDDDRLVLEGLERVPPASDRQPAFFYVHLMSTHYLGVQFPESHVFTRPDDAVSPGLEPYKILDKLNKPDRYDDKVRQADGIIRQLFDRLKAKHYLDNATVVVTGDHGEGLGERHWAHGWDLYNEDIRIPMLLYDAPAARYPDLSFAAQIDIAPTLLDRAGLPIPESWEGQSLLAPAPRRLTYHQTYFVPNRFAVLYRDQHELFKFIATPQYGKEELYDLKRDAGEVNNLATEEPELASRLREKVRAYRLDEPSLATSMSPVSSGVVTQPSRKSNRPVSLTSTAASTNAVIAAR